MKHDETLSAYHFYIEIDGIETARFQKCVGLEAETSVFEIEEGGYGIRKFPGRTRFPNIILEKGITENNELLKWYKATVLEGRTIERKNGSVILKNLNGEEIKRWNFFRALPCRWTGPRLDANRRGEYAVERIEIAHEGLEVDNDSEVLIPNDSVVKNIHSAMLDYKDRKYTFADEKNGIPEFRCDNYVESVLNDAGYNSLDYMAGKATEKSVQNHIDNAIAQGKTDKNTKLSAPALAQGVYVVYMNNSSKGFQPHAGLIEVHSNKSVTYTDNSSGNQTKGVETHEYSTIQDFQNDYGYNSFYYQEVK